MFDESVDVAAVDPLLYRLKHNEPQQLNKHCYAQSLMFANVLWSLQMKKVENS